MAHDPSYMELDNQFTFLKKQYDLALASNTSSVKRWEDYKKSLEEVSKHLSEYNKQLKCPILVPIGKKAFMKGDLVHTNECLVCLGDGWFVRQSTAQTKEMCSRRMKNSDEMLGELKKEMDLLESRQKAPFDLEAFALENTQEIIEPFNEEAEANWRIQHREKEKAYRKQLAEERKKQHEAEKIDVWEILNTLELNEGGEINSRAPSNIVNENYEYLDSEDYSTDTLSDEFVEENEEEVEEQELKPKPSVSFNLPENDDSEDDHIVIQFNHSVTSPSTTASSTDSADKLKIEKPSDVYSCFSHLFEPKSILKKSSSFNDDSDYPKYATVACQAHISDETASALGNAGNIVSLQQVFGDIVERNEVDASVEPLPTSTSRKISKFKASRKSGF